MLQDLDVVCKHNLDFLRSYEFVAPRTYPVGVSNDVMVSKRKSPFAGRLIHQLHNWNKFLFIK